MILILTFSITSSEMGEGWLELSFFSFLSQPFFSFSWEGRGGCLVAHLGFFCSIWCKNLFLSLDSCLSFLACSTLLSAAALFLFAAFVLTGSGEVVSDLRLKILAWGTSLVSSLASIWIESTTVSPKTIFWGLMQETFCPFLEPLSGRLITLGFDSCGNLAGVSLMQGQFLGVGRRGSMNLKNPVSKFSGSW